MSISMFYVTVIFAIRIGEFAIFGKRQHWQSHKGKNCSTNDEPFHDRLLKDSIREISLLLAVQHH